MGNHQLEAPERISSVGAVADEAVSHMKLSCLQIVWLLVYDWHLM